jgi:hypothetical protein
LQGGSVTCFMGVSSDCPLFGQWTEENLQKIERLIRYDLEFDGFAVEILRAASTGYAFGVLPGYHQMRWKLTITVR